jgi:hypothetical protein
MKIKIFLLFALIMISTAPVLAEQMTPSDCTSEKYLIDHGHSPEVIRMINLQKARTQGTEATVITTDNKFVKFWKNLWVEQDVTMPLTDFGASSVKTVETQNVPFTLSPNKNNYNKKNDEIYINEIR